MQDKSQNSLAVKTGRWKLTQSKGSFIRFIHSLIPKIDRKRQADHPTGKGVVHLEFSWGKCRPFYNCRTSLRRVPEDSRMRAGWRVTGTLSSSSLIARTQHSVHYTCKSKLQQVLLAIVLHMKWQTRGWVTRVPNRSTRLWALQSIRILMVWYPLLVRRIHHK